jgi:hypothetical protein
VQIVIPSKGRPAEIRDGALKLFPDAIVCVGESDAKAYPVPHEQMLVHPDDVTGIGPLRQWILDNVQDRTVVQVDDDMHTVYCQTGFCQRKITDPSMIRAIVDRTARCAEEAGARIFGFGQMGNPIDYRPMRPFAVSTWVGGLVGIIGRELRYDTSLRLRADIDFCLESLKRDRIVWVDDRFRFLHKRFTGSGGNASNRSSQRHHDEMEYLRRKWGRYLELKQAQSTTRLCVRVPRS